MTYRRARAMVILNEKAHRKEGAIAMLNDKA